MPAQATHQRTPPHCACRACLSAPCSFVLVPFEACGLVRWWWLQPLVWSVGSPRLCRRVAWNGGLRGARPAKQRLAMRRRGKQEKECTTSCWGPAGLLWLGWGAGASIGWSVLSPVSVDGTGAGGRLGGCWCLEARTRPLASPQASIILTLTDRPMHRRLIDQLTSRRADRPVAD